MFSFLRILTVFAVGLSQFGASNLDPVDPPAAPSTQPSASIELHDVDERWTGHIEGDLARFEAAGLPAVEVEVHVWGATTTDPCLGHAGVFRPANGSPRVDICIDFSGSALGTRLRHQLVLHELAHAWIGANVSATSRDLLVELRGAPSWNDAETVHFARGTELAANAMMRMLHPDPPSDAGSLCGYELLTGLPGLAGRTDPCAR